MKSNAFLSLIVSSFLTFFFLILKLFNFNEWSELLSVFYLGIVWFVFIFAVLSFLKKQFPNDFPSFNPNIEEVKDNLFKKDIGVENVNTENYSEVKDKIDINFASKTPGDNPAPANTSQEKQDKQKNQEKKSNKTDSKKPYKSGELDGDSFDFEPEKMANAVRNMLNKD